MKAPKGKLQLVIKSQKVSRFVEFEVPLMTPWGTVGVEKKRAIVYDYLLDETQRIALNEARNLARERGLIFQVTDLSRQGSLRRTVASALERIGGHMWLHASSLLAAPGDSSGIATAPGKSMTTEGASRGPGGALR